MLVSKKNNHHMLVFVERSVLYGGIKVKIHCVQPLEFGHVIADVAQTVPPPPYAMSPYMCVCVCVHIFIHAHIHTHKHTERERE